MNFKTDDVVLVVGAPSKYEIVFIGHSFTLLKNLGGGFWTTDLGEGFICMHNCRVKILMEKYLIKIGQKELEVTKSLECVN